MLSKYIAFKERPYKYENGENMSKTYDIGL